MPVEAPLAPCAAEAVTHRPRHAHSSRYPACTARSRLASALQARPEPSPNPAHQQHTYQPPRKCTPHTALPYNTPPPSPMTPPSTSPPTPHHTLEWPPNLPRPRYDPAPCPGHDLLRPPAISRDHGWDRDAPRRLGAALAAPPASQRRSPRSAARSRARSQARCRARRRARSRAARWRPARRPPCRPASTRQRGGGAWPRQSPHRDRPRPAPPRSRRRPPRPASRASLRSSRRARAPRAPPFGGRATRHSAG